MILKQTSMQCNMEVCDIYHLLYLCYLTVSFSTDLPLCLEKYDHRLFREITSS